MDKKKIEKLKSFVNYKINKHETTEYFMKKEYFNEFVINEHDKGHRPIEYIEQDYFEEYTLEKGVLIGKVSKDYAKEYFSVESIDCASSIDVSISLEEKNISSYAYSYLTSTNKTVSTNVIYSY